MTWEPCCNNYPLRTGPCFLIETLSLLAASNQAAHSLAASRRRSLASERGAERGRCPPTAGAGSGLGDAGTPLTPGTVSAPGTTGPAGTANPGGSTSPGPAPAPSSSTTSGRASVTLYGCSGQPTGWVMIVLWNRIGLNDVHLFVILGP